MNRISSAALVRVAVVAAALLVGLVTGLIVMAVTRPSDDQLQRAALDELGLPAELERSPFVGPVMDELTQDLTGRVIEESRVSAGLGLGAGLVVSVSAIVFLDRRPRRSNDAD